MKSYRIIAEHGMGMDMGIWEGETPNQARAAMWRMAGYNVTVNEDDEPCFNESGAREMWEDSPVRFEEVTGLTVTEINYEFTWAALAPLDEAGRVQSQVAIRRFKGAVRELLERLYPSATIKVSYGSTDISVHCGGLLDQGFADEVERHVERMRMRGEWLDRSEV